ncbi:hypothetical protein, partial [Ancylobacter sonchi]
SPDRRTQLIRGRNAGEHVSIRKSKNPSDRIMAWSLAVADDGNVPGRAGGFLSTLKLLVKRPPDDAGIGGFSVADLPGLVDRLAGQAEVGSSRLGAPV